MMSQAYYAVGAVLQQIPEGQTAFAQQVQPGCPPLAAA